MFFFFLGQPLLHVPVKRHRGEPGHTHGTHTPTGNTDGHTDRITQTNLTTIQTQRHTRTTTRRPKPRPTQQPQARSRPLPAADSEEAAPSKPDPASTRSQSASPRSKVHVPVKRHREEPGHTHGTHKRTRGHTDHTDEPHNHPNPTTHPHDHVRLTVYAVTKFKPECSKALTIRCFLLSDTALCETAVSLSLRFPGPEQDAQLNVNVKKAPTHS